MPWVINELKMYQKCTIVPNFASLTESIKNNLILKVSRRTDNMRKTENIENKNKSLRSLTTTQRQQAKATASVNEYNGELDV